VVIEVQAGGNAEPTRRIRIFGLAALAAVVVMAADVVFHMRIK